MVTKTYESNLQKLFTLKKKLFNHNYFFMYKTIILLLMSLILNSESLFAQSPEEKEVADVVESLRKAMIAGDKTALENLAANELSYGHSSGKVEDKAAFVDQFVQGTTVFKSINLSDQTIRIAGNVAIVRHRLTGDTNNSNVPGKVDIIILLIWQKQNGKWKLLARQAARIPV